MNTGESKGDNDCASVGASVSASVGASVSAGVSAVKSVSENTLVTTTNPSLYNEWYVFAEDGKYPSFTVNLRESVEDYLRRDICKSIDECAIRECFSVPCFESFADSVTIKPLSPMHSDIFDESPIKKHKSGSE